MQTTEEYVTPRSATATMANASLHVWDSLHRAWRCIAGGDDYQRDFFEINQLLSAWYENPMGGEGRN